MLMPPYQAANVVLGSEPPFVSLPFIKPTGSKKGSLGVFENITS